MRRLYEMLLVMMLPVTLWAAPSKYMMVVDTVATSDSTLFKVYGTAQIDSATFSGVNTFSGATIANLGTVTTANIDGGTIDGTTIGGASAAAATVTTLTTTGNATVGNGATDTLTLLGPQMLPSGSVLNWNAGDLLLTHTANTLTLTGGSMALGGGASLPAGQTFTGAAGSVVDLTAVTPDSILGNFKVPGTPVFSAGFSVLSANINSGTVDGTVIGGASAAAGTFTSLTATGVANAQDTLDIATAAKWQLANVSFTGTMANLNTLRDGSNAGALHYHSFLNASDGDPDSAVTLTNAGQLLVGHTASVAVGGLSPNLQVHNTGSDIAGFYKWSADAVGPYVLFGKSRSGTKGTMTAVQDNDVLMFLGAAGADGTNLATLGGSIVVRVNGTPGAGDIPGEVELMTYDGGSQTGSLILDAAGTVTAWKNLTIGSARTAATNTHLNVDVVTGGTSTIDFLEGGAWKYYLGYDGTNNYWFLQTTDSDGGGTDADVIRIPDGQLTVDFNATADDNAYDVRCSACGWHGPDGTERCPICGGPVEWHDDVALMQRAIHDMRHDSTVLDDMQRLGLMRRHEDGWTGMNLQGMAWFNMSGLVQERDARTTQDALLEAAVRDLQQKVAAGDRRINNLEFDAGWRRIMDTVEAL